MERLHNLLEEDLNVALPELKPHVVTYQDIGLREDLVYFYLPCQA